MNGIVPIIKPTDAEIDEALTVLEMMDAVVCAYCGDTATEWDHLRPLVENQRPTGYIHEIHNLVPACGKCNQSKGNKQWKEWMFGDAPLSPKTKGVADIDARAAIIERYEEWTHPTRVDFAAVVGEELWAEHWANHRALLKQMREAESVVEQIRDLIAARVEHAVEPVLTGEPDGGFTGLVTAVEDATTPVSASDASVHWDDTHSLGEFGFTGFKSVGELRENMLQTPDVRGVYAVLRTSPEEPRFLATGSAGFFKGKDPNANVSVLQANWVSDAVVVYIGKAGDPGSSATLRSRLRQYLRFGAGENIGHWGGRYIWQLADSTDLVFCWKPLPDGRPSEVESELIASFRSRYGVRPFANLRK
ncbi:HNH endonuclease [Microbacterium sp. NPDC077644]|uniref:HNH endonuclease signature motif containing protein n=1 Tax=Microbacterium sp. NPDC077644 TaxID=3155055 RepID=UPI003450EC5A